MLTIDNLPSQKPYIEELIRKNFSNYIRVVIKKRFEEGLSGSDVFMIRTIKTTGSELPSVIKIDRQAQINKEWFAYQSTIQRSLPSETGIDGQPVFTEDQKYGLLWYPLAGQGNYEIISLLDFLRYSNSNNISTVLSSRLFENLNILWKSSRQTYTEYTFKAEYDSFLPPHITVDIDAPDASTKISLLREDDLKNKNDLVVDNWIEIEGFKITEIKHEQKILVLNCREDEKFFKIHVRLNQTSNSRSLPA